MKRYLVILQEDGELLVSLDTLTGEALCKDGIEVRAGDCEDVINFDDGKMKHVCFNN